MQLLYYHTIKTSMFICYPCLFVRMFVLQDGKADACGSKPQQDRGHAGETATQPGGHRNAKSTSTCAYTCKHTPGPGSPFTQLVQTHTYTTAHLLSSSRRPRSFHASNFKHTRALTHPFPLPVIKVKSRQQSGVCSQCREGGTNCIGKKLWRLFHW